MPEKRSVSENHGDYEYTVESDPNVGVVVYRKPLNTSADSEEPVSFDDLPSRSLKDKFEDFVRDFPVEKFESRSIPH